MPTIKDIAKAAGVSHGTVSNVLNKREGVSYEKIRLVEQTARAMGYAIDEQASLLRRGTNRTVAVILPSLTEAQYADLCTGILAAAEERQYAVRLFLTGDMPYRERKAISDAAAMKVCGILAVSNLKNQKKEYAVPISRKIPVLFLERGPRASALPSLTFPMEEAGRALAEAALAGGSETESPVSILCGDPSFADQKAFVAGILSRIPVPESRILPNPRSEQSSAPLQLLSAEPLPKVIFCSSQALADRALSAFLASGAELPGIYTAAPLRTFQDQRYTILPLNYRNLGREAVLTLSELAAGKTPDSRELPLTAPSPPFRMPAVRLPHTVRLLAHATPTIQALQRMLPVFSARTGIRIELTALRIDEMFRALQEPGGTWDMVRLDPSSLPHFGPELCMPLAEIDSGAASSFNRFLPGLQSEFSTVRGQLYALPFDIAVQLLFYQKPLFENIGQIRAFYEETGRTLEVPSTYDAFDRIVRFFSRAHRKDSPVLYGSSLAPCRPSSVTAEYLPRLLAAGGLKYSSLGCLDLTTRTAREALDGYIRFAACTNPARVHSWSEIASNFVNGETATAILFANHASHLVRNQSANAGTEIGFAPVPGRRPLLGGGSLAIFRRCPCPDEAYRFLQWATGDQIAPSLVMLGGVSACRAVYEHREILDTYPWLSVLKDNIQLGTRQPILSPMLIRVNQREFETILGKHLLRALAGKETSEKALSATQNELHAILS